MKKNRYEIAGYISMCYLLFVILAKILGWLIIVYALSSFQKLLGSKTRSNVYDKPINILCYIILVFVLYAPISSFAVRSVEVAPFLLAFQFVLVTIVGIGFVLFGAKLKSLEDSLYLMKGQLIGTLLIVGTCYIFNGLTSFVYVITKSTWLLSIVKLSGILSYAAPILLCLVLGRIFLSASRECNEIR